MALQDIITKLREKAIGTGISGLTLVGERALYENIAPYHKYMSMLKQAHKGVLPTIVGVIGVGTGFLSEDPLVTGLANMIDGAFEFFIEKKPFVYAPDASTLEIFNFDANADVSVTIDGSAVSFQTAPKTDANGYAKITLPTAMASGKHEVVVKTTKKAWYGFVAV